MRMDINFELYKIFYHVAATGSFSEAAARLYISQSAVSQAIRSLEEKTGCTLFVRRRGISGHDRASTTGITATAESGSDSGSGAGSGAGSVAGSGVGSGIASGTGPAGRRASTLTREGELLYFHIEQAFHLIKAAEFKLSEASGLNSGEIRLGASDTVCKHILTPCLQAFNEDYPGIGIKVVNRTSLQIAEVLKSGQIDFGIVSLPVNDGAIVSEELCEVSDVFVASTVKYSTLLKSPLRLPELCQYPLLLLEKGSVTRNNLENYFKKKNISLKPEIELESNDLLVEFARIGLGISYVPFDSAAGSIQKGELFVIPLTEALPNRHLGVITLKNMPLPLAGKRFIHYLRNRLHPQDVQ